MINIATIVVAAATVLLLPSYDPGVLTGILIAWVFVYFATSDSGIFF